jgi:hypothetical protein
LDYNDLFMQGVLAMRDLASIERGIRLGLLSMTGWLAVHGTALAQGAQNAGDTGGGPYVVSYALVLLGVGLGMLLVCRASRRRDRAKPEAYDETKINPKD